MTSLKRRSQARLASCLLAILGILGFPLGTLRGQEAKSMKEIYAINFEWEQAMLKAANARRHAKSPLDLARAQEGLAATEGRLVERCLDLASRQPDGIAGLIALKMVACRSPETEGGKKAAALLVKQAASADLGVLAEALPFPVNVSQEPVHPVVPLVLERVKKDPAHPQAPQLLASVVCGSADPGAEKPPAEFIEAADLIVKRFADSPHIRNFCELNGCRWAGPFEEHLRTILDRNQHRDVRAAASFALAYVVQLAGERRQREAEKLYEEFIETYDGKGKYFFAPVEQQWNDRAKDELAVLRMLGKPAPEIDGVGLDGRGMSLSDYRGKVVVVSFWATWCGPCMKMIPHERELVKRLQGKPFEIVGVNGDDDQQAARAAVADHGMTWRSFQNRNGARTISLDWHVTGWPTFYLIDQKGIIRKRWGDTRLEELKLAIDELIDAQAESKTAK